MCEKNFGFWCCALLLLVSSSSKSQENSTNNEEKDDNLTVRYELDMNSTTNYGDEIKTLDLYEKFTNNTQYDEMQYESRITSTSNNREDDNSIQYKLDKHSIQNYEDDEQIPIKSRANSTNVNHKRNFTSQEVYENLIEKNGSMSQNSSEDSNKSNIVPYNMCDDITCIPLCCSLGDRLVDNKCIPEKSKYFFPNVYRYTNDSLQSESKRVDELFQLVVHDPCQVNYRFILHEDYNNYMIFANGSLYLSYYKIFAKSTSYCLAVVEGNEFEVTTCSETVNEILKIRTDNNITLIYDVKIIYVSFHTASILLLVSIFLVYSILPELRNVHGFMLRNYSGALCVAYTIDIVRIITITNAVQDTDVYVTIGFFAYFCFFASFFWLNVMSFDMWWTFRILCSLQRNVNQRQRKKLFYVIYAWGIPFILAIVYIIMGFVPGVPIIFRPKFRSYWIGKNIVAFILYYHGLISVCTISSLCLSISTALKIARYKRDTDNRLQDSESRRYNDNKKWFNLYLKLFIVLFIVIGIKWFIITMLLSGNASLYDSIYNYAIHLTNFMQNLCTFIIYVWKKKIKRMLLKRFGCGLFPETRCRTNTTSWSTCTTTGGMAMQEKMSSCRQAKCHVKTISDSTDL